VEGKLSELARFVVEHGNQVVGHIEDGKARGT
jgi:hypothetical protein